MNVKAVDPKISFDFLYLPVMTQLLSVVNAAVFLLLAVVHIYWLLGGTGGMDAAIPTDANGRKLFRPGSAATLTVALGLLLFGAVNLAFIGWIGIAWGKNYIRYAMGAIAVVFALRAIGDFRYVGMFKQHKRSRFAKMDSRIYSPLCLLLAATHALNAITMQD